MPQPELQALLEDVSAPPVVLMKALTTRFGGDWLTWSYEALRLTLERELHMEVPPRSLAKAMACSAVAQQDTFWQHWEHFHFLAQALNADVPDFVNHHELAVGQMMKAVSIAEHVRTELGPLGYLPTFSEEVARYVAAQALNAGVWYLPPPLEFAALHASGMRYRCKDCGNVSEVMFDDGLCDVCVDRFNTDHLGSWEPDPERLAKGWGSNIEYFEKNPTQPVVTRLRDVLAHPDKALQENQVDVCVARLIAAMRYAEVTPEIGEAA